MEMATCVLASVNELESTEGTRRPATELENLNMSRTVIVNNGCMVDFGLAADSAAQRDNLIHVRGWVRWVSSVDSAADLSGNSLDNGPNCCSKLMGRSLAILHCRIRTTSSEGT
jgi:hypothetical protein